MRRCSSCWRRWLAARSAAGLDDWSAAPMRGVHAAARRLDVGGHEALQFLLASLVGPALASLQTEVVLHVDFQSCVFFERRVGQSCRRLQASFAEASGALLADVAGDLLGRRGRHLAKGWSSF